MALFRQGSSESQKGFRLSYVTTTLELRRNKVLSQLSAVPVKICLPSTRTAYSAMCPLKGPQTETTALLWSWKKTPTAIGVSVSKLYVSLYCGAATI